MIHALGLAPSLDVVYTVGSVEPGAIHRPQTVSRLAGGKSLNVARALARLGHPVRALAPLGGALGALVAEQLDGTGVELVRLTTTAPTRMCVTVADESAGTLTEFYEHAPPADGSELGQLAEVLDGLHAGDWSCCRAASRRRPTSTGWSRCWPASGRAVRGCGRHPRAVLPLLVERAHPDLVKINRAEAAELVAGDAQDLLALGGAVRDTGVALLVLTDGAAGAVGWSGAGAWRVTTDAPPGGYPVGSGDCFLAGLVGDLAAGQPLPAALVTAAAVGAANAATPGGALFSDDVVASLRARTEAVEL